MAINPVAFSFFGLDVMWYGIVYSIGFLLYFWFVTFFAKDFGFKKEVVEDIFLYFMLFSVLGGRLFYILFYNLSYYLSNPLKVFAVWEGGMSIYGGIFFGIFSLWYFGKKNKVDVYSLMDLFSIPAGLGLAFGRLANFVNQEIVGVVTSSKLGVVFNLYDDKMRWPVALFEGFKNLIIFEVLLYLQFFKKFKSGVMAGLFLVMYCFGRFFIDFLREVSVSLGIISLGQFFSLIFGFGGLWFLYKRYTS